MAKKFSLHSKPYIAAFAVVLALGSSHFNAHANGKNNLTPAFARVESLMSLPIGVQENADKEYQAGRTSYEGRATLISELRQQKGIRLAESSDELWVVAFPERVVVAHTDGSPAASLCDVIQYRKSDGNVRVISPGYEGRCISYYKNRPIVMDLNNDGYQDLIFYPAFEHPQLGGENVGIQVFLYDPKSRFLCLSRYAGAIARRGPYGNPQELYRSITAFLRDKKMKLECDAT